MFKILQPLGAEILFAFIELFDEKKIDKIILEVYNGTGSQCEIRGNVTILRNHFEIEGNSLLEIKEVLKTIDHNQIQKLILSVKVGDRNKRCSIDAISSELYVNGLDILPFDRISNFCEKYELSKIHFRLD